jgi:hypothetical protein
LATSGAGGKAVKIGNGQYYTASKITIAGDTDVQEQ